LLKRCFQFLDQMRSIWLPFSEMQSRQEFMILSNITDISSAIPSEKDKQEIWTASITRSPAIKKLSFKIIEIYLNTKRLIFYLRHETMRSQWTSHGLCIQDGSFIGQRKILCHSSGFLRYRRNGNESANNGSWL
jgi:hypothetical protein